MRAMFALTVLLIASLLITGRAFTQDPETAAIKAAVEKSISLLQSSGKTFVEQSGCISCHHQSLPAMAVALARDRGFKFNDQIAREQAEATLKEFAGVREKMLQGMAPTSGGQLSLTAGYALVGLGAMKQPPDKTTDAMVHYLAGTQTKNGRWRVGGARPPVEHGDFMATAITLRAIQLYTPKGRFEEMGHHIERARSWLIAATPITNQDRVFQLLGLGWSKASKVEIEKAAKQLLATQRPDGGWAQLAALEGDAYATGQVLVALHLAGGLRVTDSAYRRGIKFLLKTQFDDGLWEVQSRAVPIQIYFESGFPHGKNQFVSAAATSWATMALTLLNNPKANRVAVTSR